MATKSGTAKIGRAGNRASSRTSAAEASPEAVWTGQNPLRDQADALVRGSTDRPIRRMIFISHSHADKKQADALVEYLLSALDLQHAEVRCTSVAGHQVPFGQTIPEQLKGDIGTSAGILTLLTKDSLRSAWVLFELGASWALGKVIVPILGPGLTQEALPGPLGAYPSVLIDSPDAATRMADAVAQIAGVMGIPQRPGGRALAKLGKFIDAAREPPLETAPPSVQQAMAFEIPWMLMLILVGQAPHPPVQFAKVRWYLQQLGLPEQPDLEKSIRTDDEGAAAMKLLADIGGALAARKPGLARYFEAGANLMPLVSRGQLDKAAKVVAALDLPEELREPGEDRLEWLNRIESYFDRALRQGA